MKRTMPSSSVVVLFGISEKLWANTANSNHISVLALITCRCTIQHSTAECSTLVERTNVRGCYIYNIGFCLNTTICISRKSATYFSLIHSHTQPYTAIIRLIMNTKGKKIHSCMGFNLQPNNIMPYNTRIHNIKINTAPGINSQGYKNCMFKF